MIGHEWAEPLCPCLQVRTGRSWPATTHASAGTVSLRFPSKTMRNELRWLTSSLPTVLCYSSPKRLRQVSSRNHAGSQHKDNQKIPETLESTVLCFLKML